MKKNLKKTLALLLCATLLTGCSQSAETKDTISVSTKASTKKDTSDKNISVVENLKAKYAEDSAYDYAEPMYNLEKDHVFVYDNLPDRYFDQDERSCFKVFYDSELTRPVNIYVNDEGSKNRTTISPNRTFSYKETAAEGNWGSQTKFWLVQYVDLETGEMLDTPLITVFTTKEELSAPTLTQTVGSDGLYNLSWDAVEGADYYEVYSYDERGCGYCDLEVTTNETCCTYNDFTSQIEYEKEFHDILGLEQLGPDDTLEINGKSYNGSDLDLEKIKNSTYSVNSLLSPDNAYFVVARSNDQKGSGMSNVCEVSQLANQIPLRVSQDFQKEYNITEASELPAYAKVEMVDGSTGEFLIQYHQAHVSLLENGTVTINTRFKNLPLYLPLMSFTGMDYHAFLEQTDVLTKREDDLSTKSVTAKEEVNIPFAPTDTTTPSDSTTPSNTTTPSDTTTSEESTDEPEKNVTPKETADFDLDEELKKSVYGTSALSEWIALNMLSGETDIYLGDFPECADSENIVAALSEACTQNPLMGVMDTAYYDYDTETLEISYVMDKKDMQNMQKASLEKAKEIVSSIIKDDMTDFEKEEAINQYLCENVTYNEKIFDYIKEDGSIDESAVTDFVNSFTPYGALVENMGVCESYSEAFLLLAKEAGLEAIIVTGSLEGVNHEWNRVKLEDSWYSLDVTNNDSDVIPNGYFNLSDEDAANYLKEDNTFLVDTKADWLKGTDNQYEYYTKHQWIASEEEAATELLGNMLSGQDKAAIRLEGDFDNSRIEGIIKNVCAKKQIGNVEYYYYMGILAMQKSS